MMTGLKRKFFAQAALVTSVAGMALLCWTGTAQATPTGCYAEVRGFHPMAQAQCTGGTGWVRVSATCVDPTDKEHKDHVVHGRWVQVRSGQISTVGCGLWAYPDKATYSVSDVAPTY
jgi:hypothetical protein